VLAAESAAELENVGDIQQREQPEPGAGRDGEKDDGKSGMHFYSCLFFIRHREIRRIVAIQALPAARAFWIASRCSQ
jgi:hypothetical protein